MVVLLVLLVPVVIGVFLLAMERLELELLGTTRTPGSDDALLAQGPSTVGTGSAAVQRDALARATQDDPRAAPRYPSAPGVGRFSSSSTSRALA